MFPSLYGCCEGINGTIEDNVYLSIGAPVLLYKSRGTADSILFAVIRLTFASSNNGLVSTCRVVTSIIKLVRVVTVKNC